ncbi:hypothetical protein QYE76_044152 [Lolium multiflorum]|uniref:Uncharacterized protein n=1 Tax=Lolium multiflorum TaxID=4521 RepID=A0AAD8TI97_LOLMU|nr:hypothetical protein QYE76_044152 [Lolium multiflorum]
MHGRCTARTPRGAKGSKVVQYGTTKAVHSGALHDIVRCKSDPRQCNAVQQGSAPTVHCQDTVRCKNDSRQCNLYKKKNAWAMHYQDTARCKGIQDSAIWYNKAVHGGALHDTVRCKSDPRQCNAIQKGSARLVHCQDNARCKSDSRLCKVYKKENARVIHWHDTARCKGIQCSAIWYNKAVHGGALARHCAVQK